MSLANPVFTKINDSFKCLNCSKQVPHAQSTCRDHCPNCLFSIHVDNNPGDRSAECKGTLKPTAWSQNKKKGYMIHYRCEKCGEEKLNKFLEHDSFQADDFSILLKLNSVTKVKE
ncbi:RNHCP domain-containing protein [Fluviispira multicolorata]|uniref:RNHCP domain-containing protein n=1 Tax=Fluviispira multicolorata TaxID=2654512 RepID=A0A833JES9_9BACT|nr:RNHCP domain-containing protein [Fluviispira multicolorata]KAB8030629.1 RNHCP domain-containing protein [Fluviispira multicolorata]